MAGAQVPISTLPSSAVVASSDVLALVLSGTTKKMTAGTFRTDIFAFASADPLNIGALTAVGNSSITGTLSGVTTLSATTLVLSGSMQSDLLFTDATYDIGKNGATRPRDVYLSRDLNAGNSGVIGASPGSISSGFDRLIVQGTNAVANDLSFAGPATSQVRLQFSRPGLPGQGTIGYNHANDSLRIVTNASLVSTYDNTGLWTFPNGLTLTLGGLTMLAAASKIKGGATSLSIRNNADTQDNLLIADSGNTAVRGTLSLSSTLVLTSAVSKIIPGATSFSIRDNADSADRMLFNSTGITVLNTFITPAGLTGASSLRIPHGVAPTSPVDGDMWSTTTTLNFRLNGVTKSVTLT